jgi:hypothetical protein
MKAEQKDTVNVAMKIRLLPAIVWLAISFAVSAAMAQDAMKVIKADELAWKEHPPYSKVLKPSFWLEIQPKLS